MGSQNLIRREAQWFATVNCCLIPALLGLAGPYRDRCTDTTTMPLKVYGPACHLADSTFLELTANGELVLVGGSGHGYRFVKLGAADNPSD